VTASSQTIGILGAGQLGMMLAEAGQKLGFDFRFLALSSESSCEGKGQVLRGDWNDHNLLKQFCAGLKVVSYEFENVALDAANEIQRHAALEPTAKALMISQDRKLEKSFFNQCGIPTPRFMAVDSVAELETFADKAGLPLVLKTRRMGYDGKGQRLVENMAGLASAFEELGANNLIAEEFVNFDCECSIIAVRDQKGSILFYPLIQNYHKEGILRLSIVPSPLLTPALQKQAENYIAKILEGLDYCGVLTLELFVRKGELFANEMAPRVHNSGHWSIEGALTSQFENHIRAISGMQLGPCSVKCPSAMLNLIGEIPASLRALKADDLFLHDYNKSPAPGRKLGHLTIVAQSFEALIKRAAACAAHLSDSQMRANIDSVLKRF